MPDLIAIAHRGYSARFPENTRLAYEAAILAGAPFIETDARLTADGEIICCHDPDFSRVSGTPIVISEASARDLPALDIGLGQSPLLLADVLQLADGRANVLVDVKTVDFGVVEAVLAAVSSAGAEGRAWLGLRSLAQYRHVLEKDVEVPCVGLVARYEEIPEFLELGARAVRAWEGDLDHPEIVRALREGRPVWVTGGKKRNNEKPGFITRARLRQLREAGVEGVLLNDPSLVTGRSAEPPA